MRAVAIRSFGGPEVLSVIDIPIPEPGEAEVRVRVHASPVQRGDLFVRAGAMGPFLPSRPYYVLGWDLAGTVDAVGPEVREFAVGDAVIGLSDWLMTMNGTQAEFVVLAAAALAHAPEGVPPVEASTVPATALTAAQALDLLGLPPGATLAVTGAGGAVGGYAVELAVQRDLQVVGIASSSDESFVSGLGATFVARSDTPGDAVRAVVPDGVDGVLDAALVRDPMMVAVRDGGTFVTVSPPCAPAPEREVRVDCVGVHSDGAQLAELAGLAEQGRLTLRVAESFPFEQAAEAHARLERGGVRGRLVLVP